IKIFASLFRGRTDVFAQRWEKWDGSVSGYFPVYKDRTKKKYMPFHEIFIKRHLLGRIIVGIYPLLLDNSSYFIAADFDGSDWLKSVEKLFTICKRYELPVYIERSRSGRGAHVWCFFEEPYPAYKSRSIFFYLLRKSKDIDELDKDDSFDRLFPNQDYHSGKGLGNLIALPLQGLSRKAGNSVFLDTNCNFEPALDQWDFLNNVEKVPRKKLDKLFATIADTKNQKEQNTNKGLLPITIAEYISIPKSLITRSFASFLREELNFFNAEYFVKQKIGLSTYNIEKYFKTIVEDNNYIFIPRGFLSRLLAYLKENGIVFVIKDERNKLVKTTFKPSFELFDFQKEALGCFDNSDSGVLLAPPGSGKTIMGLEIISRKKQPALIITHRKQIYNQWLESIESFLGIPKRDIGQFVSNKKSVKSPITVAMVQSLSRVTDWQGLNKAFGLLLVDECHHMPAKIFRDVVTKFNANYIYGLTATPKRKYNDEKLIFAYLGDIIYEIPKDYQKTSDKKQQSQLEIVIRDTNFSLPFLSKHSDFQFITKILTFDSNRNTLIVNDIVQEVKHGSKCLVLTERKDHVDVLHFYLKRDFEIVIFTGGMTPKKRAEYEKRIEEGQFQVLIATGQLLGEGSDISNLDCLFLVFPFSFEGKLIQYIGRIQRGEGKIKKVYDYRDGNIEILESLFKKRNRYYK
ncbi:MAG: DEAD/DEAH box helicase family protein, partial [Thermodesulfobacteriota bacterium]